MSDGGTEKQVLKEGNSHIVHEKCKSTEQNEKKKKEEREGDLETNWIEEIVTKGKENIT